jgi:hypothetical protein
MLEPAARRFEHTGESIVLRMIENQLTDRVDTRLSYKNLNFAHGSVA